MKIRIIGPCGSGKSYISKKLSERLEIPYYELDHLVWNQEEMEKRNTIDVRDSKLRDIISRDTWIIEGSHISWTRNTFEQADLIFLLIPHPLFNDVRIIKRFILSRLGMKRWNYKQSFSNLIKMIVEWNHGFDSNEKITDTDVYDNKRHIVYSSKQIYSVMQKLKEEDLLISSSC